MTVVTVDGKIMVTMDDGNSGGHLATLW